MKVQAHSSLEATLEGGTKKVGSMVQGQVFLRWVRGLTLFLFNFLKVYYFYT